MMNQLEFEEITCNLLKELEKSCVPGFGFVSHWLKNWHKIFQATLVITIIITIIIIIIIIIIKFLWCNLYQPAQLTCYTPFQFNHICSCCIS